MTLAPIDLAHAGDLTDRAYLLLVARWRRARPRRDFAAWVEAEILAALDRAFLACAPCAAVTPPAAAMPATKRDRTPSASLLNASSVVFRVTTACTCLKYMHTNPSTHRQSCAVWLPTGHVVCGGHALQAAPYSSGPHARERVTRQASQRVLLIRPRRNASGLNAFIPPRSLAHGLRFRTASS